MISRESRREFEKLRVHEVQKRVDAVSYGPVKYQEAIEWLEAQDPARRALRRSTIAIVISIIAIIVTLVLGVLPYIIKPPGASAPEVAPAYPQGSSWPALPPVSGPRHGA